MEKSPIIILHGWGLSGEKFIGLQHELASIGYRVFAPDLPGFGKSEAPSNPYYLSDYANFLRVFIQKHRITRPILIGHSFGGRVSLKYQQLFPHSVRALVLTGTPGFTPVSKKRLALFVVLAKFGKLLFSIPILEIFQERVRKWYYFVVGARDFYRANGVMRETFKHIVQEDLVSCMRSVTAPCILIWGSLDQITPIWIAQRMKNTIANAELIIITGADHGVSFKEPQRFVSALGNFLKSV